MNSALDRRLSRTYHVETTRHPKIMHQHQELMSLDTVSQVAKSSRGSLMQSAVEQMLISVSALHSPPDFLHQVKTSQSCKKK